MLAFLADELSNVVYLFSTFADVNKDEANNFRNQKVLFKFLVDI